MVGSCGLDLSGPEYRPVTCCSENGNEPSGSIQGGKFLDYVTDF
jgi:hypothetical protein